MRSTRPPDAIPSGPITSKAFLRSGDPSTRATQQNLVSRRNEKTIQRRCSSAGPAQRASTDTDDPSRQLHMPLIKRHGPSINPCGPRAAEIHRRLSSSLFGPALEQFLSSDQGLSASTITRLTTQWQDEARAFNARPLAGTDYVYVWVDGIHLKVRLEADKVCLMVVIGVRADGRKELVCLADGYRESADSWADLLRDAKRRGMAAPVLAVGEGRSGSGRRSATSSPRPRSNAAGGTRSATSLAALPTSAQPTAKRTLAEIYNAEDKAPRPGRRESLRRRVRREVAEDAAKITDDLDVLLTFYDYPAEHWDPPADHQPDRVDVRHRPAPAAGHHGPGSRAAGAMASN